MKENKFEKNSVHTCIGECFEDWQEETGGVVEIAAALAKEKASASPAELGKLAYIGCIACHGAGGEGGIGPAVAGQSAIDISMKLTQYKNGETRGNQSALMWSQAAMLSGVDIENISEYIETM
ncbi:MAG: cytochrome c553 [Halioglobus sp.]|jgi:cytochrome c553